METRSGACFRAGALHTPIDLADLGRTAQEGHELYLSGEVSDNEDPVVDTGPALTATQHMFRSSSQPRSSGTTPAVTGRTTPQDRDKKRFKYYRAAARERRALAVSQATKHDRLLKTVTERKRQGTQPHRTTFELPRSVKCSEGRVASSSYVGVREISERSGGDQSEIRKGDPRLACMDVVQWDGR